MNACVLILVAAATAMGADPLPAPSHDRPYFMPEERRQEILKLVRDEPWAKEAYARAKQAADKGDGYWAAFLYALEGDQKYVEIAQKWLLHTWGAEARETVKRKALLDTPENWKGPENSVDWYRLDVEGYVAFDWAYRGLPEDVRENVHRGLAIQTRYRMACMDSWGSTANLNYKPISMIALAALTLGDADIMRWAFQRTARQGNYFSLTDRMLFDGGPWHEAPIYPIDHKGLWCMTTVAFYGRLYNGKDWFGAPLPRGGSPRGLMDYYIDTAYPIERTGVGAGRIRIATYGDGATGFWGGDSDHFLLRLAGEFALGYAISGDEKYAAFVTMSQDYQPNLWDRRALPQGEPRFPAAPSKIWPTFGLAMLRSDESPRYWTNPDAIAVLLVMTQGYGHDHRDKFGITLFGANRLLYPDYLGIQYERLGMGWTNTPVCHNMMMVDDQDAANVPPVIRSEFAPESKFLATSATGVFEGVEQTRALVLTGEYLLDLFQASSKVPHMYDYVLNSLGMPQPVRPDLPAAPAVSPRYWAMEETRTGATSGPWALDFIVKEDPDGPPRKEAFGPEWYQHVAKVRVTMAPERDTRVSCGTWGPGKFTERAKALYGAKDIPGRWGAGPPHLGMLVARRDGRRSTVFAAAHEPYANAAVPRIRAVTCLAQTDEAIVVRVDAEGFTDYVAAAWGADAQSPLRVLASSDDAKQVFAFRNYAYLRVPASGDLVARGGWSGFRIPVERGRLMLNGKEQPVSAAAGYLTYGELPAPQTVAADPENPFTMTQTPALARLPRPGQTQVSIGLTNTLKQPVTGRLELDLPTGVSAGPQPPTFGPVPPGGTAAIPITLAADEKAAEGRRTIPFRLHYRAADAAEVRTQYLPLPTVVGTSVQADHTRGEITVDTPGYTARLSSISLATTQLADPDGTVRLSGTPLFTFTNEEGAPVVWEESSSVSVWLYQSSILTGFGTHCRYATQYQADRMRLPFTDRTYTRMKEAHFTIPGNWASPAGAPRWNRIIAVDDQGKEFDAKPAQDLKIAAAEIAFPESAWSIAIMFSPPRKAAIDGLKVQFVIPIREPETSALGFCKPGMLDQWRQKGK